MICGDQRLCERGDKNINGISLNIYKFVPIWDSNSARIVGFKILSLAELGRPRIDITIRESGLFRDIFPELNKLRKLLLQLKILYQLQNLVTMRELFFMVINGFMIQGGGLTADMSNKSSGTSPIQNEVNNGLSNDRGTIAMARTMDPHSATSQFCKS